MMTERHRSVLVAVTDREAITAVPALRADDLLDLGLHQLVNDPEADTEPRELRDELLAEAELAVRTVQQ